MANEKLIKLKAEQLKGNPKELYKAIKEMSLNDLQEWYGEDIPPPAYMLANALWYMRDYGPDDQQFHSTIVNKLTSVIDELDHPNHHWLWRMLVYLGNQDADFIEALAEQILKQSK